jgi:hypothetical protein
VTLFFAHIQKMLAYIHLFMNHFLLSVINMYMYIYKQMSDEAITKAMEKDTRPSLKKVGNEEDIPSEIVELLEKAWSKNTKIRPSASHFESQFRKCVDERYGGDPRNDQLLSLLNIDFLDSSKMFEASASQDFLEHGGGINGNLRNSFSKLQISTSPSQTGGLLNSSTNQLAVFNSSSSSPHHHLSASASSIGGGGYMSPTPIRWDHGLDVGQLRLAFLEMAESGVIFERAKELSLHLSRTQNKPFVHDSETNQSIFLDEVYISCLFKLYALLHLSLLLHFILN